MLRPDAELVTNDAWMWHRRALQLVIPKQTNAVKAQSEYGS
jgi:hypothetical protein